GCGAPSYLSIPVVSSASFCFGLEFGGRSARSPTVEKKAPGICHYPLRNYFDPCRLLDHPADRGGCANGDPGRRRRAPHHPFGTTSLFIFRNGKSRLDFFFTKASFCLEGIQKNRRNS